MNTGRPTIDRNIYWVAAAYFFISAVILYTYNIQLGGEAEKYIDNAGRILNGQPLRNGFFGLFYVLYSLLVAFFVKFSIPLAGVAIGQVLLSFYAGLLLYRILLDTLDNRRIALFFFIAYLLCYPMQKWNFFLYSESLHNSLLLIGLYLFYKWQKRPVLFTLLPAGFVLLLILFSRPTGIVFLMTFFVVLITWLYRNGHRKAFFTAAGIAMIVAVAILNSPLTAFVNPDSIRRMEVICQVPETNTGAVYEEFNRQGLMKAFQVIRDEVGFGNFIKTGIKKLGYFFGMYRPYYSRHNNLLLLCYMLLYPLAIAGIFFKQRKPFFYLKLFSLLYLVITSFLIFFTCDDWANRFISPVFPFILILAAGGIDGLVTKFRRNRSLSGSNQLI
ncbi:MAG TPA: hypothetical protein DCQ97_07925 [Chitinophagaceae bacterium]|nr:hypothetical protein [Chitinophagaceae bacterium]